MSDLFSSEFFSNNRARLRELFTGTAPIVITANGQLQRSGDTTFPFQQDANFWYLTGIDEPDVILVIDKQKEYLIVPFREGTQAAFDGHIEAGMLARQSGIDTILSEKEGWKQLEGRLHRVKHVATIPALPRYIEAYSMYTNPARKRLISRLKTQNDRIELLDISEHLARMRMVKQAPELVAIQRAIDITSATLTNTLTPSKRGKYTYEYEIEAELSRGFRTRGARGHAFDPIVASGKNATTIHYLENNAALSAGELIVLDVGAEYDHYAADITRTIALREPTKRQTQVYDAVQEVQQYACSLLKPGVLMHEYENDVEHFMGEKLRELGLIKSIDRESVRTYYPHAASHHLGLNVHDVGDGSRPLEPDMVITVEPGIYIPEEELGVRIEDDVRITENSIEVLSVSLPTKLF
jgi:Xaa-Pro aminopeptidase